MHPYREQSLTSNQYQPRRRDVLKVLANQYAEILGICGIFFSGMTQGVFKHVFSIAVPLWFLYPLILGIVGIIIVPSVARALCHIFDIQ